MPIHLPAQTRRQFLVTVGAGLVACRSNAFGSETEDDLIYLLNDTHIGEKHPSDSAVPSHLRQVVNELIGLQQKPSCVLINGDLALKDGQPGDYKHFAKLIAPLREANIDLHLTLGNHAHHTHQHRRPSPERRNEAGRVVALERRPTLVLRSNVKQHVAGRSLLRYDRPFRTGGALLFGG